MSLRLGSVSFDCAEVGKVAEFWSAALDRPIDPGATEDVVCIGHGSPLAFYFQRVPEPKTAKSRTHPDLWCDDRIAEVERLVGLGATHVADHSWDDVKWSVLRDVEGNEFCLAQDL
ncbi:MAG: VOC family protein [Sporichthyaceae bacterium]